MSIQLLTSCYSVLVYFFPSDFLAVHGIAALNLLLHLIVNEALHEDSRAIERSPNVLGIFGVPLDV
jgi:hypothetical protein